MPVLNEEQMGQDQVLVITCWVIAERIARRPGCCIGAGNQQPVSGPALGGGLAPRRTMTSAAVALRRVKLVHTVAWAFFAGAIVAIPVAGWLGAYRLAAILSGIVFVEALVLVFNGWRCPLTDVAARYTDDRRDNFDIYLPEWLARHNKTIFSILYVVGMIVALARWSGWLS